MAAPLEELAAVPAQVGSAPAALEPYLAKVRERAYTITDADIEELKTAGVGEDEIFEQTVAAAIGEGLRRLEAGLRALE